MPIYNQIINQKGTPAFYSDIFANRPAFGYAGRVFISTDTGAIYEDTGSAWTLIADAGAGTTGTLQQVTTNGNTTTLGITIQGIDINDGAGTGVSNTAIGLGALQLNTTGAYNTTIGYGTLQANTTGSNNVATGLYALFNNTTGNNNVAIGQRSLTANTTGFSNVGIGSRALTANTTGAQNVAIGTDALYINTTGNTNTAIGTAALSLNTTGGGNTAIGVSALNSNTTANFNTAVGGSSLAANTTGANNVGLGYQSLNANTTGAFNTAIGNVSLNANTTGSGNTAIGYQSQLTNTTGVNNNSLGFNSLRLNTTGGNNVGLGTNALQNNTTASDNTAIGNNSLNANTTGTSNTAVGSSSLIANTTGSSNTAIGYSAGSSITTGSNNTIIGNYVGTPTLASNIVLSDGAGNVRLFSDANGLIGINQAVGSTIGGQLDIHSTQTYALVLNGLSTSNAYTAFSNASVGKWRIGNTYNAGANTFDIFNLGTSSNALSFNSTTNASTFIAALNGTSASFSSTLNTGGDITANDTTIGSTFLYLKGNASTGVAGVRFARASTGAQMGKIDYSFGTDTMTFRSGGNDRMYLFSDGNLSIDSGTNDTINKLQVNGGIASTKFETNFNSTTINSSTNVNTAVLDVGIVCFRDATNGGGCVVFYENGQTPIIISQSGPTSYTTLIPPTATQIQISDRTGSRGLQALGGSLRNGVNLIWAVFRIDGLSA